MSMMNRAGDVAVGDQVYNFETARLGSPIISNPTGVVVLVETSRVLVRWDIQWGGTEKWVARKQLKRVA